GGPVCCPAPGAPPGGDAGGPPEASLAAPRGSRRGPLPRPARRRHARAVGPPLPRALQPRVPPGVRRVAAPVPAHAPPRARRVAAENHRSLGRRHLLQRRSEQRRVVHHELRAHVRRDPDGLPRGPSAGLVTCACALVRAARLEPPAIQHVWRRQPGGGSLASVLHCIRPIRRTTMLKISHASLWVHDQDEAVAYYTDRVGLEIREDVTLPELGGFRWVTVGAPGQDDVALALIAV